MSHSFKVARSLNITSKHPSPQKSADKEEHITPLFSTKQEEKSAFVTLDNSQNYIAIEGHRPGFPNRCLPNPKIIICDSIYLENKLDSSYGPSTYIQIMDNIDVPLEIRVEASEYIVFNFTGNFGGALINSLNVAHNIPQEDPSDYCISCQVGNYPLQGVLCANNIREEEWQRYSSERTNFLANFRPPSPPTTPPAGPGNTSSSSSSSLVVGLGLGLTSFILIIVGAFIYISHKKKKKKEAFEALILRLERLNPEETELQTFRETSGRLSIESSRIGMTPPLHETDRLIRLNTRGDITTDLTGNAEVGSYSFRGRFWSLLGYR